VEFDDAIVLRGGNEDRARSQLLGVVLGLDHVGIAVGVHDLVGGTILYASWEANPDRSLALPGALTVLLGGVMLPTLPGNYQQLAVPIITVGLAAGFVAVGKKYVLPGGSIQ